VVAAVDIADGDAGGEFGPDPEEWRTTGEDDGAALRRALTAVLGPVAGILLPWHDLRDLDRLVDQRLELWEDGADAVHPQWVRSHDGSRLARIWSTARQVARAAADARAEGRAGLAQVLDEVRRELDADRDAAWDDGLTTFLVARPPRFRLRASLDLRTGRLLEGANDPARRRWPDTVDPYELPIPVALAARVPGPAARPPDPAARPALAEQYRPLVTELGRALGPAYAIEDGLGG
jgi:hypothetical protein